MVLVEPVTENALLVGVHDRQEEPPAGGHADVQEDVVGHEPTGVRGEGPFVGKAHEPAEEDGAEDGGEIAGA